MLPLARTTQRPMGPVAPGLPVAIYKATHGHHWNEERVDKEKGDSGFVTFNQVVRGSSPRWLSL